MEQSTIEEITNARSVCADIFKIWNDDRMLDNVDGERFSGLFSKDQIIESLSNTFEAQYYSDMTDRLGKENVADGLLNIYRSFNYGMTHPEDPKVSGMDKLCVEILMHCIHNSKFKIRC